MSQTVSAPRMSGQDWLALFLLSVLWGATFFFAKIALVAIPPMTLVLGRVVIAALALFAWLRASGVAMPRPGAVWRAFFVLGLLNNVLPFNLIFWGQHQMPTDIAASLASILNATTPLFAVVIAHFLTRDEKLTRARASGVLLGFAGVALLLAPRLWHASGQANGTLLPGAAACLTAACVYTFAGLYGRRFKAMGVMPMQVAFGQLAASSLLMLPIACLADRPWTLPPPGWPPVLALIALALVSTAVAYVLYFRILARAGATNLLLVTFLIPVTAILLSSMLLGETLELAQFAAMALIGLGLACIDGRMLARLQRVRPSPQG